MGAKRVKDLIAAFVVGNGVLDLLVPRQRALLWVIGPKRLRQLIVWLAEHPTARRLQGALRVGIGLWLALRQYQQKTPRRPWHDRYQFSEYRSLAASWLAVLALLAILLSAFAVMIYRRRSSRGEGSTVEEQEACEAMRRIIKESVERSRRPR